MRVRRLAPVAFATALLCVALVPSAARATFHLMRIREVYPGSAASPGAEYVELQMFASGQNFVGGHVLRTYDEAGSPSATNTLAADVPSGDDQRTVLLATPEAEAQFGVQGDDALAPSDQLDPAGGAVCWEALDCVSWGSFAGSLPSPAGSSADPTGIPDGMALRRNISPGCPTLLEPGDDSDDSVADFSDVFPTPRPNATTPAEHPCSSQVGGPGGVLNPEGEGEKERGGAAEGSGGRLQTLIHRHPAHRTRDRSPTFTFSATSPRATYSCRLDHRRFRTCRSPFTPHRLSLGRHVFEVRARTGAEADPSPAVFRFRVVQSA
jgi:hypothetical protein